MTAAEFYKLRKHRMPLACATILALGVIVPSIVMIWYRPGELEVYAETYASVLSLLGPTVAIVFGGWVLGTEYRQGTVKRMLTSEPRRLRALWSKALVGAVAVATTVGVVGGAGWATASFSGSFVDASVPFEWRVVAAAAFVSVVGAAMSFALSAITRSDSFAIAGTVATLFILDPLIGLIPKVGKFAFGSAVTRVESVIDPAAENLGEPSTLSLFSGSIALGLWMLAMLGAGSLLFARRDV